MNLAPMFAITRFAVGATALLFAAGVLGLLSDGCAVVLRFVR